MVNPPPLKRIPVWIALGVILLTCLLRWANPEFLERLERITYDMRVREALRFPAPVSTNLGFIYIDEESIRQVSDGSLGFYFGLYWPRQVYGRAVAELAAQGAETAAFDVIFGELRPDHPPVRMADDTLLESDEFFALQLRRAGNVVLAATPEVAPPALFATNAAALADITTEQDSDGVLRRARLFRVYRRWHPVLKAIARAPEYGIDLARARIEANELVLPRINGEEIKLPLNAGGEFTLADVAGDLPSGWAPTARPFTEERLWQMGVVMAARRLGLDLEHPEINLERGWITLRGPSVERRIPVDGQGRCYIDWGLPLNAPALTRLPIHELLRQNHSRLEGQTNELTSDLKGKSVVVGSAALLGNDLADRGATPLEPNALLVSKHWNVANSIILDRFVRRAPLGLDFAIFAALGAVTAAFAWRLPGWRGFAAVAALAAGYLLLAQWIYVKTRFWLPMVMPLLGANLMMMMCLATWRVVFEQAEQRRVKSIFSTIVSEKIVSALLKAESLALGGARREITVFFADVRGFTEFTDASQEQVAQFVARHQLAGAAAEACFDEQARETLQTINTYLGLVADIVIRHDGTLDKFIGDCVMAFWGAPASDSRHATHCVQAAREAQRAIQALNRQRALENELREKENPGRLAAGLTPRPLLPLLSLGSGINTGIATVGLMGSEAKTRNYTVFGREVNLASRLEGASGRGHIYISETTFQHLQRDSPALAATCVELAPLSLKGFSAAVKVYEVPAAPTAGEASAVTREEGLEPARSRS